MSEDAVQHETYQYPYEPPPLYPTQAEPAYWYPSAYQPLFWQALVAGIADVAMLVIVGSQAFSVAKKAFKGEEEKP